jgi:hypothetical protein
MSKACERLRNAKEFIDVKSAIVMGLIGVGVLLVIISGVWASMFPGTASWTPEKAERLTELRRTLHNLAIAASSQPGSINPRVAASPAAAKADYDRLKPECDALLAEVKATSARPNNTATMLRWTGISLAGLGLVGWFAVRQA